MNLILAPEVRILNMFIPGHIFILVILTNGKILLFVHCPIVGIALAPLGGFVTVCFVARLVDLPFSSLEGALF